MTSQLTYLVTRQNAADLARAAERARLADADRPIDSAPSRRGWISRLFTASRLEVGGSTTDTSPARGR